MKLQTAINWTGVAVLIAALVLPRAFGLDAEPLPDPGDLTDAQHAAVIEHQRQECANFRKAGYIFFERADGSAVCRDGGLK
jgi:hypothetical protein